MVLIKQPHAFDDWTNYGPVVFEPFHKNSHVALFSPADGIDAATRVQVGNLSDTLQFAVCNTRAKLCLQDHPHLAALWAEILELFLDFQRFTALSPGDLAHMVATAFESGQGI